MKRSVSRILIILWKDVLLELRTRDVFTSVLFFALLVIVVFSFAFEPGTVEPVAPGVLWVAFAFAGVLGMNRSFVSEKETECLEGLMLCPVERDVLYFGKMTGILIFMLMVEAIVLPVFSALFNLPIFRLELVLVVFLASVGFASVGTLFSAMAVNTKAREIMLPILFFPIVAPVIIAAVKGSEVVLAGEPWSGLSPWLQMLGAFDAIFLIVSSLIFEFVLEQ